MRNFEEEFPSICNSLLKFCRKRLLLIIQKEIKLREVNNYEKFI